MSYYWGYPKQPTIAELKSAALREIARERRQGADIAPVPARTGRNMADSWWGESWCDNLERYADYSNRIGRGKKYVRAGCVIDLKIDEGVVTSRVMGSRGDPYGVTIHVKPMSDEAQTRLLDKCGHKVESLEKLLDGEFPHELQDLFTERGGLFPSPAEIHFHCTCPDWANMCKHVAATLYGVGSRLDADPMMFFQLRGIDPNELIGTVAQSRLDAMLANADRPSRRILQDDNWADVFGLEPLSADHRAG